MLVMAGVVSCTHIPLDGEGGFPCLGRRWLQVEERSTGWPCFSHYAMYPSLGCCSGTRPPRRKKTAFLNAIHFHLRFLIYVACTRQSRGLAGWMGLSLVLLFGSRLCIDYNRSGASVAAVGELGQSIHGTSVDHGQGGRGSCRTV